ncbi:MAG: PIN domain-containing protein [Halobacteriaceae archaeon]
MRVAMDASALMMPVEAGVRVFEELDRVLGEYDPVVPAAVVDELDGLAGDRGEAGRAARVGRDLARRCETVETEASYADDALVELVREGGADAVVTNDGPLRERLRATGAPVIHLRGRNKLTVTD